MRRERELDVLFVLLLVVLTLTSCDSLKRQEATLEGRDITRAVAVLHPTVDSDVRGTVVFTKVSNGTQITVDVRGLSPGSHGLCIHEFGDCSAPDASSAGAHFNPTNTPHGGPESFLRHVGDLGNVSADGLGRAKVELHDELLSLDGKQTVVGRALIVYAEQDDLHSQPDGGAGSPLACGVIGIAGASDVESVYW
jgi:Cu-Zn family superoxide dismutase